MAAVIPAIFLAPVVDADVAVAHADDNGWDADWAAMTPEQIVADMRRFVPPLPLADAFTHNETLYRLWAQWRLQRQIDASEDCP